MKASRNGEGAKIVADKTLPKEERRSVLCEEHVRAIENAQLGYSHETSRKNFGMIGMSICICFMALCACSVPCFGQKNLAALRCVVHLPGFYAALSRSSGEAKELGKDACGIG